VQDLKAGNLKEAKPQEESGIVNMKDQGLGDTIARATKATGLDKLAQQFAEGLNIPGGCGCKERQAYLNKVVPYGKQNK
jgi:hypothetical protein